MQRGVNISHLFSFFLVSFPRSRTGLYPMARSFSSYNDNIVYFLFKVIEKQQQKYLSILIIEKSIDDSIQVNAIRIFNFMVSLAFV